jgi:hypothetical protein
MNHLMRAFLQVWINFGSDRVWGMMSYPPLKESLGPRQKV